MVNGTVLLALREDSLGGGVGTEQLRRIGKELENRGLEVRWARSDRDARAALQTEAGLAAAVVGWDLPGVVGGEGEDDGAAAVLRQIGRRFKDLPVFLVMADESEQALERLPLWVSETVVGYVWPLEDTAPFIAGRIVSAARAYQKNLLPPFFRALRRFDDAHEYSWHTPAHSGGVAFLKSPVGRAFFDYFGERLFRSDLSISVEELGSLFEHTGPIGEAERNAARVFGADRTYFVLHGDSTADRMVGHYSVTRDEIALVDRNCHKSVLHGLVISGARPVYLVPDPQRLRPGGPAAPARDRTRRRWPRGSPANPLTAGRRLTRGPVRGGHQLHLRRPVLRRRPGGPRARAEHAPAALRRGVVRLRPLPPAVRRAATAWQSDQDTFRGPERPTVFSTQSTHKLLAALSQSAMVHVRPAPRAPVEHDRFNEAFMMHGTTSPLYPMIASLDVATAMMDGPQGAVADRRGGDRGDPLPPGDGPHRPPHRGGRRPPRLVLRRLAARARSPTRPPANRVPFADAPAPTCCAPSPPAGSLEPGADWHGFPGPDDGYCMLDPDQGHPHLPRRRRHRATPPTGAFPPAS